MIAKFIAAVMLAGFLGIGGVATVLYVQKTRAEAQAATLRLENDRLRGRVATLDAVNQDQRDAIAVLESTQGELNRAASELRDQLEKIRNAADDQNAAISPLLDDLLRSLDRVRPRGTKPAR